MHLIAVQLAAFEVQKPACNLKQFDTQVQDLKGIKLTATLTWMFSYNNTVNQNIISGVSFLILSLDFSKLLLATLVCVVSQWLIGHHLGT